MRLAGIVVLLLLAAACDAGAFGGRLIHVKLVKTRPNYDLVATLSHSGEGEPYGINAWSVTTERGQRLKTVHPWRPHPAADEFESWMTGVEVPPGTKSLTVRVHDKTHGFEGSTPLVIDMSKPKGEGYEILDEDLPLVYRRYHGEHVKRLMRRHGKFVPFVW